MNILVTALVSLLAYPPVPHPACCLLTAWTIAFQAAALQSCGDADAVLQRIDCAASSNPCRNMRVTTGC